MSIKVKEVDYGIANRAGNIIYVNHNIFKYKKYAEKVMDHEKRHSSKPFTWTDLKMDLTEGSLYDNLIFCFKHPKAFLQFSPILKLDNNWFIDLNLIIVYLIGAILIWILLANI